MTLRNNDDPRVKNRNKCLLVQWNTWKHRQYRGVDDDDNDDMVITCNNEDNYGAVGGVATLLLLNSADQELQKEIASGNIIVTVNQSI